MHSQKQGGISYKGLMAYVSDVKVARSRPPSMFFENLLLCICVCGNLVYQRASVWKLGVETLFSL